MSTAADARQVILDRVAAREVVIAKLEAERAADMLTFQDMCRAEAEQQPDPRIRDLEASFAADELGVVLHQPTRTVQVRLSESRRVRNTNGDNLRALCRRHHNLKTFEIAEPTNYEMRDNAA